MTRVAAVVLLIAAAAAFAVVVLGAGEENDDYKVRAIFENAGFVIPGEDVKVAGVRVGSIAAIDVTDDYNAAVVLDIEDPGYQDFRNDASCIVRPQSLIGERFVECTLTEARSPGEQEAPALEQIEEGDGEGQYLLPVERNAKAVDIDLLNNIMRLPYRERFTILLNEFGSGLAGRGRELNEVIHRANPALRETDRVLATLARQNRVLADLARDSDAALGPLARERRRVSDWIVQANATAQASAERREDISRGINRLPAFLRELRPLMADLESVADQGTPLLADLGRAAPNMDRLIRALGTVSEAGRESFPSLGDALERGRPALIRARPLFSDLRRLGREAGPATEDLDELTASLQRTDGIERINDFLYYLALNTNGFDAVGHYLRAGLVTNTCSQYFTVSAGGCNANFYDPFSTSSAASAGPRDATFGSDAAARRDDGNVAPLGSLLGGLLGQREDPSQTRQREQGLKRLRKSATRQSRALGPEEPMLEYLLGGER